MPGAVAIVMGASRATMKLELALNRGSSSGSLARVGSGFYPQVLLSKPHTRKLKLFVRLNRGAALQLRKLALQGPLVSVRVQHTPSRLFREQCYRSARARQAWQSRASQVHNYLVSRNNPPPPSSDSLTKVSDAARSRIVFFIIEI